MHLTNMGMNIRKKIICVCICIAGVAGGCTYYRYAHPNIKKVLKETELRAVPKEYKQNIKEENKVTKSEDVNDKDNNTSQENNTEKENTTLATTTDFNSIENTKKQVEIKRDTPYIPKYSKKEKTSLIEEAKSFYKELKRDDRGWDFSDDFLRAYENFEKEQTSRNYSKLEELLGLVEVSLYNTEFGGE